MHKLALHAWGDKEVRTLEFSALALAEILLYFQANGAEFTWALTPVPSHINLAILLAASVD